jgi:uncharacterized FAD-dependent dehydrogenase
LKWRIFNIDVLLENDPGKDDTGIHPSLLLAVANYLSIDKLTGSTIEALMDSGGIESVEVVKKAFDPRRKRSGQPKFVYTVDVAFSLETCRMLKVRPLEGRVEALAEDDENEIKQLIIPSPSSSAQKKSKHVVVVGAGPAGLFAALTLVEQGIAPIIIERGQPVEKRGRDIGALFNRKILNPDSNLCYG